MKPIFIRELRKAEKHSPSATKNMSTISDKTGFDKVYMPYGEEGRGYYYIERGVK